MAHDLYAPKRPQLIDNGDPPPAFLLRQDRDRARLAGVAAVASAIHEKERLADYIDSANTEEVVPTEEGEELDLVAGLKLILQRLTYSQMKQVAAGILEGAEHDKVVQPGGMADALEAWSSKEKAA